MAQKQYDNKIVASMVEVNVIFQGTTLHVISEARSKNSEYLLTGFNLTLFLRCWKKRKTKPKNVKITISGICFKELSIQCTVIFINLNRSHLAILWKTHTQQINYLNTNIRQCQVETIPKLNLLSRKSWPSSSKQELSSIYLQRTSQLEPHDVGFLDIWCRRERRKDEQENRETG